MVEGTYNKFNNFGLPAFMKARTRLASSPQPAPKASVHTLWGRKVLWLDNICSYQEWFSSFLQFYKDATGSNNVCFRTEIMNRSQNELMHIFLAGTPKVKSVIHHR